MMDKNILIIITLVLIICVLSQYSKSIDNFNDTSEYIPSNEHKLGIYPGPADTNLISEGNIPQLKNKLSYEFSKDEINSEMNDINGKPHTRLGFAFIENAFSKKPLAPHYADRSSEYLSSHSYDNIHNITQEVDKMRESIQKASNIPNSELLLQLNNTNNIPVHNENDDLSLFKSSRRSDMRNNSYDNMNPSGKYTKIGDMGSNPDNSDASAINKINQQDMDGVNNIFAPNIVIQKPIYISSDVSQHTIDEIMNNDAFQLA
jgi:hypothetical protein